MSYSIPVSTLLWGIYTTMLKSSPLQGRSTLPSSVTPDISLFPSTCPSFVSIPLLFAWLASIQNMHSLVGLI